MQRIDVDNENYILAFVLALIYSYSMLILLDVFAINFFLLRVSLSPYIFLEELYSTYEAPEPILTCTMVYQENYYVENFVLYLKNNL